MPEYFRRLGDLHSGSYKCALFRDRDSFSRRNLSSPEGRGYPDISAQAAGCDIVLSRFDEISTGTACAVAVCLSLLPAPSALHHQFSSTQLTDNVQTAAGVVSLLNDFLISNGRKPLGFLNPWLYGAGRIGLTDIIAGSNPGCGTDGFFAVVGWDPVRPARLVSFHFRHWLILCSIGHGSRDAKFWITAKLHSPRFGETGLHPPAAAMTAVGSIFHMCLPFKFACHVAAS